MEVILSECKNDTAHNENASVDGAGHGVLESSQKRG
jgi:hypothetical protein